MKRWLLSITLSILSIGAWAQGTDFTIGNGTSQSGTSGVPTPFEDYFEGDRTQSLFLASELKAAGMGPGFIYAIKYNVLSIATNATIWGWTLSIGTTTASSLNSFQSNINTIVYSASASTPYNPGNGVKTYTLPTPFFWNGVDNIVLQTCHGSSSRSNTWTSSANVYYTSTSFQSTYTFRTDGMGNLCSYASGSGLFSRINTTFTWGAAGMNNASAAAVMQPTGKFCPGTYGVQVKIKNNGQNRINNVKIYWELDGVLQPVVNYNSLIDTFSGPGTNEANITLGNVVFAGSDRNLRIYTSMPNGVADTVNLDDTLKLKLGPSPKSYITPDGPTVFCTAGTINVKLSAPAGAGSLYQWFRDGSAITGATNSSYQATIAGDYTVRIDSNGCDNTSAITRVDNLAMPLPLVHPAGYPVLCSGDTMTLVANAGITGATYQWQYQGANIIGATNASLTVVTPGNYTVITTKYVCSASSPGITVVSAQKPTPLITEQTNGTLMTDPTYIDFQWAVNGTDIPGATNFAHKPTTPGNYTVRVSNGGCSNISPAHPVGSTFINNINSSDNNVSIYPNPASSVVYINAPSGSFVSITSIDGKNLITHAVTKEGVDVRHLTNGIYLLKVSDEKGNIIKVERLSKIQ